MRKQLGIFVGVICVVAGLVNAPAALASGAGLHVGSRTSVLARGGKHVDMRTLPHASSHPQASRPMLLRDGRPSGSELSLPKTGGSRSAPSAGTVEPNSFSLRTNGLTQATSTCEAGCPQSDAQSAISQSYIVEVVDDAIGIYHVDGTPISSASLDSFFNTTDSYSHPRVLYDYQWRRWVVLTQDNTTGETGIGVSDTADPSGTWFTIPINWNGANADYPILGMSQDAVVITANRYSSGVYINSYVAIYKKAWLYNGTAGSIPAFLVPFNTAPSVDEVGFGFKVYYLLSADAAADTFTVMTLSNVSTQPKFKAKAPIAHVWDAPTSWAAQPGTSALIDVGDGRFEGPISRTYNGHLWFVHTIDVSGFPTVEYGRVNGVNNVISTAQAYHASSSSDFGGAVNANFDNPTVAWAYTDVFDGTPLTDVAQLHQSPFPVHLTGQPFSPVGGAAPATVAYGSSTSVSYDLSSTTCTSPPTFISAQYYSASTGEWVTRFVHNTAPC